MNALNYGAIRGGLNILVLYGNGKWFWNSNPKNRISMKIRSCALQSVPTEVYTEHYIDNNSK